MQPDWQLTLDAFELKANKNNRKDNKFQLQLISRYIYDRQGIKLVYEIPIKYFSNGSLHAGETGNLIAAQIMKPDASTEVRCRNSPNLILQS